MPRAAPRNELEREFDLLFIANLARQMGSDFSVAHASRLLNAMRANVAREYALALGLDDEDVEEAVEQSQISGESIRHQVAVAMERLRQRTIGGMAVLLDTQVAEVHMEIEQSYKREDSILKDIELSRRPKRRVTKGYFRKGDGAQVSENGQEALRLVGALDVPEDQRQRLSEIISEGMATSTVEPEELTTYADEVPAKAALYGRLTAESGNRRKLREELRALYYGREFMARSHEGAEQYRSQAQAVIQEGNQYQSEDAAVAAMEHELKFLISSEQMDLGPWTPEMVRMQRQRTQDHLARIRGLKELREMSRGGKDGEKDDYVLRVVDLDPETGEMVDFSNQNLAQ